MTHNHAVQVLEVRINQLKNLVNDEIARTQSLLSSISESNFTAQHHLDSIKELSATVEMLRNPPALDEVVKRSRKKVEDQ